VGKHVVIWDFMDDEKTINELNLKDLLPTLEEKLKSDNPKTYIS